MLRTWPLEGLFARAPEEMNEDVTKRMGAKLLASIRTIFRFMAVLRSRWSGPALPRRRSVAAPSTKRRSTDVRRMGHRIFYRDRFRQAVAELPSERRSDRKGRMNRRSRTARGRSQRCYDAKKLPERPSVKVASGIFRTFDQATLRYARSAVDRAGEGDVAGDAV